MAERYGEMEFRLCSRKGYALVEVVSHFKYLGWAPDQTDDDWLVVQRNFRRARRVWGSLGKIIQREWVDTKVAEMFYRVVLQAVGLFGLESWAVLAAMEKTVEGAYTGFLRKITGKRARWIMVGV